MVDALETSATETLNAADIENVPVCPMNPLINLEKANSLYKYKRATPDTRWFRCPQCDCHIGYHRMKKKWVVDPYDLDYNNSLRECFGLPLVEEKDS